MEQKKRQFKKDILGRAEMKALLKQNKSLCLKRLLHDSEEIKNQIITIPGVTAVPLSDNLYEWHGNIKCLCNNIYKDAVIHLKFLFPEDYPLSPPEIYVLNTNIVHPNILNGGKICLDILEKNKKDNDNDYVGWKCSYTVLSILLQLQNFFFESQKTFLLEKHYEDSEIKTIDSEKKKNKVYFPKMVKDQLESWSKFECPNCNHKGNSNPFPKFPEKESINTKLTEEQYKKIKIEELCCYFTKENIETKTAKDKNSIIGLGINISKTSRTGEIKSIEPSFDLISFKTYTKERLRYDLLGKRFTHFFPLYFGQEKQKETFLEGVQKAISFICKGNTKEFQPSLVLKAMTKFFNACCLNIVNEKVNISRAIEILLYIYRVLILLVQKYPEIKKEVEEKLENFIKNPEERIKEKTPSLGDILVMLCVSDHKIEELLPCYISEQMDRQIFWILTKIPELEKLIDSNEIDEVRDKICFQAGIISQQLLLFYYYFLKKVVYNSCDSLDKFAKKLDDNFGSLSDMEISLHRKEINKLLKIDNYYDYYKFMEMKVPNKEELNKLLKEAFKNSKQKKYHGFDEIRYVPCQKEQIEYYMKKYEPISKLFESKIPLEEQNPNWDELLNCFDIVKQYKYTFPKKQLKPLDLIKFYREKMNEKLFFEVNFYPTEIVNKNISKNIPQIPQNNTISISALFSQPNIRGRGGKSIPSRGNRKKNKFSKRQNKSSRKNRYNNNLSKNTESLSNITSVNTLKAELKVNKRKFVKKYEDEEILEKLNTKQLCLKLFLEEYVKYFKYIGNFKKLYRIVETIKDDIPHFSLIISNQGILKSNYNFVRGILTYLTSIKYLELIFTSEISVGLLRNLIKGLSNLNSKGKIEHLKIIVNPHVKKPYSTKEINLLSILDIMPNLQILDVSNIALDMNSIVKIKNHLYYYKKLKILDVSNCDLNDETCNELADGIMKAKTLEKLYISGNKSNRGLANIIYNLAFQPLIQFLDISNNNTCDKKELVISLYKFIKMSQSVKTIIANNIIDLNNNLTKEFFTTLGDNNNLSYLDISNNGNLLNITQLGKAIAFNALKNGSLEYIDISNGIKDYHSLTEFIKSMYISEFDHNEWYGFQFNSKIAKETPKYHEKVFNCNLKTLVLKGGTFMCNINYLLPQNEDKENPMKILINKSKHLDTLILNNSRMNNYYLDSISEAIRGQNNITYLSLSNISIQSEFLKYFIPCFFDSPKRDVKITKRKKKYKKKNYTENPNFHINGLDLSCNNLSYSSIEALCQALEINKTLKYLNLFHNKLDVSGGIRIGEVLKKNNNLTEIDIGYNRIKSKGFKNLFSSILQNNNSSLKKIGLKYNFIRNYDLQEIFELIEKNEKIALEEIELKNNLLTSNFLPKLYEEKYKKMKKNITVDIFDILYNLEPERIERTVWINKGDNDKENDIYNEILKLEKYVNEEEPPFPTTLEIDSEKEEKDLEKKLCYLGIPIDIKKIRGRKTGKKKENIENNAFIEFIMPNSTNRMLKIGNTNQFNLCGIKRKVFKAGTRLDYFAVKKRYVEGNMKGTDQQTSSFAKNKRFKK